MIVSFIKTLANSSITPTVPRLLNIRKLTEIQNKATVTTTAAMCDLNIKPIVWIDCEMTGLDLQKDRLMEIACLVTDSNLKVIAEGPNIIIHQPDALLETMDSWCTKTHTETGLLQQCRESKISEQEAEEMVLTFLRSNVKRKEAPLGGNTIYMDRLFLRLQMPSIDEYLHHRLIDVSSIKELCSRWNANISKNAPGKKQAHRALDDIYETIEELQYYRKFMFLNTN